MQIGMNIAPMTRTKDHYSEDALEKKYDLHLLKRLLPFIGKYRFFFFAAILLITIITIFELSLPYITKIAIDRYIVPGERSRITASRPHRSGIPDTERMFHVRSDQEGIMTIVQKYPGLFTINGETVTIPFQNLDRLSPTDLVTLRKRDIDGVILTAIALTGIVILNFFLNFIQTILMEYTSQMIMHDLRMALYQHMQHLSISYYTRNPVGRLVTRATNDTQNLHEMFTSVITFVFKDLFLLIGITAVLFSINFQLAIISLLSLPVVLLTAYKFADMAREIFRTLRVKLAEINSRFSETIQGMQVIQLFLKEEQNYKRFKKLNRDNYVAGMEQVRIFAVFMPVAELLGSITIALVIFYGGGHVLSEAITLGALVAFISYMKMFFRPIRDIAEKFSILQNSMSSAERIFQIFDNNTHDPEPEPKDQKPMPQTIQALSFQDVSFSYFPNEPILSHISFQVTKGETIAVVGPTGAGKTSLINLIVRFYDPIEGAVHINGTDIRAFSIKALRKKIALVSQDPFLFSGSLRENISNDLNFDEAALRTILEAANLSDLVGKMTNGLDTPLSEGGASLSSGERQLISIARALSKNPDLIIFDEATSYIDSGSEILIQKAVSRLLTDRTAIIIAHRLATAKKADRIYVLKEGRFIEQGSHDELMEKKGYYCRLSLLNTLKTEGRESLIVS